MSPKLGGKPTFGRVQANDRDLRERPRPKSSVIPTEVEGPAAAESTASELSP